MASESCRIREHALGVYRAVTIENARLSVTVLPQKGGEIYSIVYRPLQFDILWKAPWGLRRPGAASSANGNSQAAWMDCYGGGWQGIFPNGGTACVYRGASLGFHGEASVIDWDYRCSVGNARARIEMSVRLARSPFRLRREVSIEGGSSAVDVRETISNDAEGPFDAMWGHHPALSTALLEEAHIDIPAKTYEVHLPQTNPNNRVAAIPLHQWPHATGKDGGTVDLSRLPGEQRISEMGYLSGLEEGRYRLSNSRRGLAVELSWDKRLFPYVWHWLEWRGSEDYPWYGCCRVGAFEPFSSIPGAGLTAAIERGTALRFASGESVSTELRMRVVPLEGSAGF